MIRVAINGYGRIGRLAHRIILEKYKDKIEIAAINTGSSTDILGWMYLLKYDTVYGSLEKHEIKQSDKNSFKDSIGSLFVDAKEIPIFNQKDPSLLPWKDLNIDVVIESTGKLRTEEKLKSHITAGAKGVILTAPAKEGNVPSFVLSVNSSDYKGENLISSASCTTNCIAPIAKIMLEKFGIEKAMMTTIHAYTSDQNLQDGGHKDYRRARAAGQNIIPTSTGATKAAAKAIPQIEGKFSGLAIRVPVATGSLSDVTFIIEKQTTREEVNDVFREASQDPKYSKVLAITEDPIVSSDIIGSPYSSIVDLSLTQVVGGNMVKIIAWYDNEFGYANRLVEEIIMVGEKIYAKTG